jgi:uncharacterized membrane protein
MRREATLAGIGGIGIGAALMYFLDPDRGTRRRHFARDRVVHAGRTAGKELGARAGDAGKRAKGLAASARSRLRADEADDQVIEARVRAELGRFVSHPGAITVEVDGGRVTLSGPVLAHEAEVLLAHARRVRGVTGVENLLEVHETGAAVPALQGAKRRRRARLDLRRERWTSAAPRLLTSVAGGSLALYGARRRGGVGATLGLAGLALLARGAANTRLDRLVGIVGGHRAVEIRRAIRIRAPVDRVYAALTEWERWPHWMSHVREVTTFGTIGGRERSHWVVDGPLGEPVSWDATTTSLVPNREIAWKTDEGAAVEHAGVILLAPVEGGGTRVELRMSYSPPASLLGHAVAASFGRDPKRQLDDDLMRLKTTIETGRPPRDAAQPDAARQVATGATQG